MKGGDFGIDWIWLNSCKSFVSGIDIKLRQTGEAHFEPWFYEFEVFYCRGILQNYELVEFSFIDFRTIMGPQKLL